MTCASDAAQPFVIATKGQVMARPPQINFEVDTAFEKEINAVITKSGMKRTDYYRMISRAFVDADADGRPFLANTPAIDQIRFAELFYKLDAFTIETERLQKDNAKRLAKLQKTTSEDELAIAHAQRDAARAITSSIVAELTPLRDELEQLARSANRPSWLPDVHKKLDASIALSKRARLQKSYQIQGWNLPGWGWAIVGSGAWFASIATFLLLAAILPQWLVAVPAANTLLSSGSGGVCALVERRLGGPCEYFNDQTGSGVRVPARKVARP